MTRDKPPLPPGLASAWGVTSPGQRGPKPGHSLEEILEAAMDLADTQGFAAVSLGKVAAQLGLTTTALYRYVGSRDELFVLLRDAGWGPPPTTIRQAANWREAATTWTQAVIDGYAARPWLLDVPVPGAPMTPRLLSWLEVLLESFGDTGLSDEECLGCAMLLDGYAHSRASLIRKIKTAATQPVQAAAAMDFLLPRLRERGFPVLASMLSSGAYGVAVAPAAGDDDFGLTRILDGIELLIQTGGADG